MAIIRPTWRPDRYGNQDIGRRRRQYRRREMLLGMSKPIHVLVPSVTARGIVNLSALAVLETQALPSA